MVSLDHTDVCLSISGSLPSLDMAGVTSALDIL
jgi:hypothetical protein